ncbi:unnamed protein product [Kuraishia capsulata CBS 1993]|uniref:Man(5)GlcNAc(2)-PP-dolichol translocation protein RFT1 n=1 Tax=Kuraishia capsulata CBS 1993 TaxID=1382522 RepID=W6MS76_9ASCO|nr:uncharacterized protein KUCA_T00005536001 [Kuraishia capsulata CBS 1993]CDK29544.1 unnamed protein product [Kuraishia capsulata CBS 1993]
MDMISSPTTDETVRAEQPKDSLLNKSASGATILVLGQVFSRLSTFTLNQLVIRFVSPSALGVTSYIEFLVSSILFFSREGIRLSCQRLKEAKITPGEAPTKGHSLQKDAEDVTILSIINFSLIPVLLGAPVTFLVLYTQLLHHADEAIASLPHLRLEVMIIALAVALELLSEPLYNVNQYELNLKRRTKVESIAASSRCVVQFLSTSLFFKLSESDIVADDKLVVAYCLGQLAYSASVFGLYFFSDLKPKVKYALFKLSSATGGYYFNTTVLSYWKSIFFQLVLKHMLTEGDRFLINKLCSTEEQGIFALINNYGSLIARMLFSPIEESIRMFLTKISSSSSLTRDQRNTLVNFLSLLFKFYIYLCIIICVFAPPNIKYLLEIVIGRGWSKNDESSRLLFSAFKTYWLYIPFLCVNGIMEAIFYSLAFDPSEISRYSRIMGACSLLFFGSSTLFIRYFNLSVSGLVLANMISMTPRIVYCWSFVNAMYRNDNKGLWSSVMLRGYAFLLPVSVSIWAIQTFSLGDTSSFTGLLLSGALGFVFLVSGCLIERDFIRRKVGMFLKTKSQ